jgi:hypothetical protein
LSPCSCNDFTYERIAPGHNRWIPILQIAFHGGLLGLPVVIFFMLKAPVLIAGYKSVFSTDEKAEIPPMALTKPSSAQNS